MIPHSIRLRQPWDELPASGGHAVYRRKFNCPSQLDAWESVSLEIDRVPLAGELTLNGQVIGTLIPGEYFGCDITSRLQPGNELVATVDPATALSGPILTSTIYVVDPDEPAGSPIGDVRLVIRAVRPGDGATAI